MNLFKRNKKETDLKEFDDKLAQIEKDQEEMNARLTVVELQYKNITRIK